MADGPETSRVLGVATHLPVYLLLVGANDPGLVREYDIKHPIPHEELVQYVSDVGLRGVLADHEVGGDLEVRQTARDEL